MTRFIWLSYDLGLRGDYEGLYAWLDADGAKECGDGVAAVNFEVKKDLLKELRADLAAAMETDKRTRVYVMYLDPASKRLKGTFLMGRRRAAPWTGYAGGVGEEDEGAA